MFDAHGIPFVLLDIVCLILAGLPLAAFNLGKIKPYQRGFFCNDESIGYPFHSSTVTSTVLYTLGFILPICSVTGLPFAILTLQHEPFKRGFFCNDDSIKYPLKDDTISYQLLGGVMIPVTLLTMIIGECVSVYLKRIKSKSSFSNSYVACLYKAIGTFLFGAAMSQSLTDIGKYSIGRLRPHFLDVCKPDWNSINCSSGAYIEKFSCSGDPKMVNEARPGLTTTAIGAVDLQGAGGNWATVAGRSRGGRRVHRQREKRKGKGRELADMMERRKEEFVRNVLEVGCELEEKERFWSELDEVMESIPTGERVVIGADFNGHVGEGNTGDEEVMGKFGVKERNLEGQMVVDFAKRMDMAVVNTYFQKREEHRVTYKSGGRRTQKKRSKIEIEKKTKWWKLKKEECCEEFRQKLRQALGGQVLLPDDWETTAEVIRETGRKVLGVSSGRRKEDKETWWWNEEVQDSIQRKRLAKKKWDMDRTEENRQEYKELQCRVKREVSKAKQKAYDELYTRLDTREGEKDLYRLARQRDRDGKDVQQVRVIKDRDGRVLTSEESVQRRWKEYFEELMNEENEREKRVEGVNSVEQKVDKIRKDEVRKALKRMKSGKAVGPDDIPVEVWKCLGEAAVEFLTSLFNRVLESERMPEEWRRRSVWERVVEARLRKVVEICEQQYGFMPRKSTTDAIFALRILMEKYRDGQRELHCVFVDLEKAYDRVPREKLWYCMRRSGVAEKYVRVVQDMYERSRTVVRCAVGQTEEFNVEVGLHQGSALSPFLFAIVMDQLSEEVRQESPWTMMFADDIVICSESREQVEENLERWRFALERRGMKVSRSKTEYMCVNEREGSGTVRLQGEEVKKVQDFKYLGSTVQSNGECGKEVKKRVQAGWNGWRKVSGVLCDRKISARIKRKVYRTVVRPAMLYGLETVSLRKRQESELEVAELKMLRLSFYSGHSSFSMYCMLFLALYLQARLKDEWARLLRPTIQFFLVAASVYTGLSRVSDYKHHWSDVLTGLIQGAIMALLVVRIHFFTPR
ncbi:hypothetical protein QTP70_015816, partial [Hemibagrus guttatus]